MNSDQYSNDAPALGQVDHWEVVWRGVAESDAHIIRGSLEADGIEAVVSGARREYALLAGSFDHGDYAVFVPQDDARRARRFLLSRGEGRNIIAEPPEEEETTTADTVRFVLAGVLVLIILTGIIYFASR
jgi:hypothetical protein